MTCAPVERRPIHTDDLTRGTWYPVDPEQLATIDRMHYGETVIQPALKTLMSMALAVNEKVTDTFNVKVLGESTPSSNTVDEIAQVHLPAARLAAECILLYGFAVLRFNKTLRSVSVASPTHVRPFVRETEGEFWYCVMPPDEEANFFGATIFLPKPLADVMVIDEPSCRPSARGKLRCPLHACAATVQQLAHYRDAQRRAWAAAAAPMALCSRPAEAHMPHEFDSSGPAAGANMVHESQQKRANLTARINTAALARNASAAVGLTASNATVPDHVPTEARAPLGFDESVVRPAVSPLMALPAGMGVAQVLMAQEPRVSFAEMYATTVAAVNQVLGVPNEVGRGQDHAASTEVKVEQLRSSVRAMRILVAKILEAILNAVWAPVVMERLVELGRDPIEAIKTRTVRVTAAKVSIEEVGGVPPVPPGGAAAASKGKK